MRKARLNILMIFLTGFIICFGAVEYLKMADKIYQDTFTTLLIMILKVYSPPLGIILAGFFSTEKNTRSSRPVYQAAVAIGVIWNLLFMLRLLSTCAASSDSPKDIIDYFEKVSLFSSFLIAAALSYYFFNSKKNEP